MAIDEKTRQRLDREYARERFLERWFLRGLMFWFIGVLLWHVLPPVVNPDNWPQIFKILTTAAWMVGAVATGLGALVTLCWIGSGGQLFSDDFYD